MSDPHPSGILMSDSHSGKVPGAGDTDEASDEEHRGPGAALHHPSDILIGERFLGQVILTRFLMKNIGGQEQHYLIHAELLNSGSG